MAVKSSVIQAFINHSTVLYTHHKKEAVEITASFLFSQYILRIDRHAEFTVRDLDIRINAKCIGYRSRESAHHF